MEIKTNSKTKLNGKTQIANRSNEFNEAKKCQDWNEEIWNHGWNGNWNLKPNPKICILKRKLKIKTKKTEIEILKQKIEIEN